MKPLNCDHCGGKVEAKQSHCSHCGIPLPPDLSTRTQTRFTLWFIAIVIFCLFMMYWLPPIWTK